MVYSWSTCIWEEKKKTSTVLMLRNETVLRQHIFLDSDWQEWELICSVPTWLGRTDKIGISFVLCLPGLAGLTRLGSCLFCAYLAWQDWQDWDLACSVPTWLGRTDKIGILLVLCLPGLAGLTRLGSCLFCAYLAWQDWQDWDIVCSVTIWLGRTDKNRN